MTERAMTMAEAVTHPAFADVDLCLREGGHIDVLELDAFAFLEEARPVLEGFYDQYGCDLCRSVDGYYYLLPRSSRLGQRTLSAAEMLVGQALCLLRLDPATLRTSGRVRRIRVVELLDQLVGAERLAKALNPHRRHRNLSAEAEEVRKGVDGALRSLARLGFVEAQGDELVLRAPLMRFSEAVPETLDTTAGMQQLLSTGSAVPEEGEP